MSLPAALIVSASAIFNRRSRRAFALHTLT